MDDIVKKAFFGPVIAVVYTIEFQKRGLPHVHIIVWLDKNGPLTASNIDKLISAQLPDPTIDPVGYEAVKTFMIHGPCGAANPNCPCMVNGECSKHYPKEYSEKKTILQNGHVWYAHPDNGVVAEKNGIDLDNRFVVPHNVDLLVKYQAHIYVERVNRDGMEKYLFKYLAKGFDCARVGLQRRHSSRQPSMQQFDEIRAYLECRSIAPNEAAWRLLQFDIHYTDPAVERLQVHMPFENGILFTEDGYLEQVLENPRNGVTKLTAWFIANRNFPQAAQYTYAEFPKYFTWHGDGQYWAPRKNNRKKVGRLANVGPNQGNAYYLRMLLHIIKGAKSYSALRAIGEHRYPTIQAACHALGLLGDDSEWSYAISDAAHWALPYQLRDLFVTHLFSHVMNPLDLFEEHAAVMGQDAFHHISRGTLGVDLGTPSSVAHTRSFALAEIDRLLRNSGHTLDHFHLPQPDTTTMTMLQK
ncbi:hypothetical protein BS78_05G133500 [Paspalum vaginatum]|nr:hypothetical protein BS78_05G133500 [Paspalum vaginatum]